MHVFMYVCMHMYEYVCMCVHNASHCLAIKVASFPFRYYIYIKVVLNVLNAYENGISFRIFGNGNLFTLTFLWFLGVLALPKWY